MRHSFSSAPSLTLVREAVLSFAPDSAAGPSGLGPQHIKWSLLPGYRDEFMRSLHAVVRIMAEGRILGIVVAWIARASLRALTNKDSSHRPVAVDRHSWRWGPRKRLRGHRPRHQMRAPHTRQRRKTVPLFHGLGARFQRERSFLSSSGNPTSSCWLG